MLSDGRIKRVGWAGTLWVIIDLMSRRFVHAMRLRSKRVRASAQDGFPSSTPNDSIEGRPNGGNGRARGGICD